LFVACANATNRGERRERGASSAKGYFRSKGDRISAALVVARRVPPGTQGRPTNGRSRSMTLATSVQQLLDNTKRRKFSMPRSLFRWEADV
jgi:hypothetical protein